MNDEWFQDRAGRSSRSWSCGDERDWDKGIGNNQRGPNPWSDPDTDETPQDGGQPLDADHMIAIICNAMLADGLFWW